MSDTPTLAEECMSDGSHGAQVLTEIEAMLANSPPTLPKTEHMPLLMVPEKLPEKAESEMVCLRFDSWTFVSGARQSTVATCGWCTIKPLMPALLLMASRLGSS
jgi:hypothetical protein